MEKYENGSNLSFYRHWEKKLHQPYDYKHEGLLQHIMSNKIVNATNPILNIIKGVYEHLCVFMLQYVDVLNNFKNPSWKNR